MVLGDEAKYIGQEGPLSSSPNGPDKPSNGPNSNDKPVPPKPNKPTTNPMRPLNTYKEAKNTTEKNKSCKE